MQSMQSMQSRMSRTTGSLPRLTTQRSMPSLQQSLATPGNRSSSSTTRRLSESRLKVVRSSGSSSPSSLPPLSPPKTPEAFTPKGSARAWSRTVVELCTICLDPLDDIDFAFPCGHQHRLHYDCSIHFLGSGLSAPLPKNGGPGPLTPEMFKSMGTGFRAVDAIEESLAVATDVTKKRLNCPLCRANWPDDDESLVSGLMAQLRRSSAKRHAAKALKLRDVLLSVIDRCENGEDAQRACLTKSMQVLERNLHTGSTFFGSHRGKGEALVPLLRFLYCRDIHSFSMASSSCNDICYNSRKLRVPFLRLATDKVRGVAPRVSAADLISLSIYSFSFAKTGSINHLDTRALALWLTDCYSLKELSFSGVQWEKVDPGGVQLGACVAGKNLRVLDLSHTLLTDLTLQCLVDSIKSTSSVAKSLEVLNLELNCITEVGLQELLSVARNVREWGLKHNKLGDGGCLALKLGGARPQGSWDLRNNNISSKGCEYLLPVFEEMTVARLGCNPLGDEGVSQLAYGLGQHLRILDLRQAQIGDAGAEQLGLQLRNASSLVELLLSGNNIEGRGALALASGWAWIADLKHVDLNHNALGSSGVERIVSELPYWHQTNFRLSLRGVECGDAGVIKIKAALQANPRHDRQWIIELQQNPILCVASLSEIRSLLTPRDSTDLSMEEPESTSSTNVSQSRTPSKCGVIGLIRSRSKLAIRRRSKSPGVGHPLGVNHPILGMGKSGSCPQLF